MKKVDTKSRLLDLRSLMKERGVDIYIIPSEDSHHSEYIAPCDARRAFISGFTGSAGCAIVTNDMAALATDGRYFNQAVKQLDDNWLLLKQGLVDVPTWQEWTAEQSSGGKTVAVDPALIPGTVAKFLEDKIKRCGGAGLQALEENLVDVIWGSSRPTRPDQAITVQPLQFAGNGVKEKLKQVRASLAKRESPALAVTTLDDIAWLFNLRGADIPYNPVFFCYAIVTAHTATLYVQASKLTAASSQHLLDNNVGIRPYNAIIEDARLLSEALLQADAAPTGIPCKRFTISDNASWALKLALGGDSAVDEVRSLIGDFKAVKNHNEICGLRASHIRDGTALVEYLAWLEDQLVVKKTVLDEVTAADKLEQFREKQQNYVGLSFATVSATGANAAIIHYQPERSVCSVIDPDSIYLCDSGAQYLDGTTDTTRTVHFGKPTAAERRAYTLVLKGNIALDMTVFPKGTSGFALDCLARQHLWRDGLDYRHSTGHGVGSYLNVHEGPIRIGTRPEFAEIPLQAGNVVSNEPGYYEDGAFGIRIENVVMVTQVETPHRFGGEPYLGFENVTMVPLCRNLIQLDLLNIQEKQWLNDYHAKVFDALKGRFADDVRTLTWLTRETRPL